MKSISEIKNEIEKHRLALEQLESELEEARKDLLDKVHEDLGYSKEELLNVLKGEDGKSQTKSRGRGRGRSIPVETRKKVEEAIKDGYTGKYIAEQLKVSVPYVQGVKEDLGLVKKRVVA